MTAARQVEAMAAEGAVLAVDHPEYEHAIMIPATTLADLLADLGN